MRKLIIYIFSCVAISSCTKDAGPIYNTNYVYTDTVEFNNEVQPIFNAYCVSCHHSSNSILNLTSGSSYNQLLSSGLNAPYVDTVSPTESKLYKYVTGESALMPPTGEIPGDDINKIYYWIEQGAKNN